MGESTEIKQQTRPQLHMKPYGKISPEGLAGSLRGQVAFITGAGRGIGRAIAIAFAEAGADLALLARTQSQLEETAEVCKRFGIKTLVLAGDVTDVAHLTKVYEQAEETLGPIDIVISNAGSALARPFLTTPIEDIWQLFELNVKAPLVLLQTALRQMVKKHKGIVIVTTSRAGSVDGPFSLGYGSSKAGLIRAVTSMQEEMKFRGEDDIDLYACHPGAVPTEMSSGHVHPDFDDVKAGTVAKLKSVFAKFCDSPELCAWAYVALAAGKCRCLKGRYVDVEQDLEEVAAQSDAVLSSDLYKLKVEFLGGLPNDGGNLAVFH